MQTNEIILAYDAFLRAIKQNSDVEHVFLLGAGASISSGVQPAADCIWEWKRDIFISKNPGLSNQYREYKSENIQISLQKWLDNEGTYPSYNDPEEYSKYALLAYPIEDIRRKYFENICRNKEPYIGYKLLCLLAQHGIVRSVFTTNFDGLVVKAAYNTGLNPIEITLDSTDRIYRPSNPNDLITVALHGDFKYGELKNTTKELDNQNQKFVELLTHHLYDKHLVVIGYSGRDKSLMKALTEAYSKSGSGMLFWCGYGYDVPSQVHNLISEARKAGRQAFFIPTDGFDNTLNHIARSCYENKPELKKKVELSLAGSENEDWIKTPFSNDITHYNTILRSNLFPVSFPKEIFQFKCDFKADEKDWEILNNLTENTTIVAAPLKGFVYALGTLSEIHHVFGNRIKSEVRRTPVTLEELKGGTVFKNLMTKSVINGICVISNISTDNRGRIFRPNDKKSICIGAERFDIVEAAKISLFFDNNTKFGYLSLKPSFILGNTSDILLATRLEIGRKYYDGLLKRQANPNFNLFLEKWKLLIFPTNTKLEFDYPINSGTGFKFKISPDTMHAKIMKAGTNPNNGLVAPSTFNQNTILHSGIQYREPELDFYNSQTGSIAKHFHPMKGLVQNRPYDFHMNGNVFKSEINLGIICNSQYCQLLSQFLFRLNQVHNPGTHNPDYLIEYPGFYAAYGIPLNVPTYQSNYWKDINIPNNSSDIWQMGVTLCDTIKSHIDELSAINNKLVVVIFIPTNWNNFTRIDNEHEKFDLHDQIKAYAAQKGVATQFIQEETFNDPLICQINWWLSLSFYVKALRTPWILSGLQSDTAFVGIGYSINHRSATEKVVLGCSHIYNSFGQGLKYKLTKVDDCYIDRKNNPFLSYQDAFKFGVLIRELFLNAMGDLPKRVVVHKRTHFRPDEINGIVDSLRKGGVEQIDLVEIAFEEDARFLSLYLKDNQMQAHPYPLSRGTCFLLSKYSALLWTHGIVPSIRNQYGNYYLGAKNVPTPLKVTKHYGQSNISTIATEILGLTKMNWNSFDLYTKLPSTIETSNEIAKIGWLLSRFEGKNYDYRNFM